jgi:hypothetical protein
LIYYDNILERKIRDPRKNTSRPKSPINESKPNKSPEMSTKRIGRTELVADEDSSSEENLSDSSIIEERKVPNRRRGRRR